MVAMPSAKGQAQKKFLATVFHGILVPSSSQILDNETLSSGLREIQDCNSEPSRMRKLCTASTPESFEGINQSDYFQ